jgi:hypothetical protein
MGESALPGRHRIDDLHAQHHRPQHQDDPREPIEQGFTRFARRVASGWIL